MHPTALRILGLAAVTTVVACTGSAAALTLDEEKVAQSGQRFEVRCGEPQTVSWALPQGAERVDVLEPVAGQPVMDGFGDKRLATVQDVALRTDGGGRAVVDITVVGAGATCDGLGLAWQTGGVEFRARYHLVSEVPVLVSDDQAGIDPRVRPARLTANADAGWRALRWRSWGGTRAVARGVFHARRWVPIGYTDVVQRDFSYRVRVTLSRIRLCGDRRHYYTRIQTRFLTRTPAAVRRQARPPATAGCLA